MRTEIPFNKAKMMASGVGAFLFVVLGCLLIINTINNPDQIIPLVVKVGGSISIVFFGGVLIVIIIKLLDKKPAMVIDENGILDNASGVSAGLITWKDITHTRIEQVMNNRFLIIYTTNPEKYLQKVSRTKAWLMKRNMAMYGSPITIPASTIKYNLNELQNLILIEMEKHSDRGIA